MKSREESSHVEMMVPCRPLLQRLPCLQKPDHAIKSFREGKAGMRRLNWIEPSSSRAAATLNLIEDSPPAAEVFGGYSEAFASLSQIAADEGPIVLNLFLPNTSSESEIPKEASRGLDFLERLAQRITRTRPLYIIGEKLTLPLKERLLDIWPWSRILPARDFQDKEPCVTWRPGPWDRNLDDARLMIGSDLLLVLVLNHEKRIVDFTEKTFCEYQTTREPIDLHRFVRMVSGLSFEDWDELRSRAKAVDEPCAIFDQYSIESWLSGRIDAEHLPHSVVIGWRDTDSTKKSMFYVSAWSYNHYEIKFPIGVIAHVCEEFLGRYLSRPLESSSLEHFSSDFINELFPLGSPSLPLRFPCKWLFDGSIGQLYLDRFHPAFIGQSYVLEQALSDLSSQLSRSFQSLYGTRPPHRNEQQERVWRLLCRTIDLDAYRDRQPFRATRVGRITRITTHARTIAWEDEQGRERILLNNAPHDFADIPKNQRFEATVLYHPGREKLSAKYRSQQIGIGIPRFPSLGHHTNVI
jgi:hypothetical protein